MRLGRWGGSLFWNEPDGQRIPKPRAFARVIGGDDDEGNGGDFNSAPRHVEDGLNFGFGIFFEKNFGDDLEDAAVKRHRDLEVQYVSSDAVQRFGMTASEKPEHQRGENIAQRNLKKRG